MILNVFICQKQDFLFLNHCCLAVKVAGKII
jgi:hypothetical protein